MPVGYQEHVALVFGSAVGAALRGKPKARELFEAFRRAIESIGQVEVVSNQTDLKFMTRVG